MYQIRLHGRGGQGVVTAAELIAMAAFAENKEAQAFPSFGVERTGAPIEAFAKISNETIKSREKISDPDFIVVQDPTLATTENTLKGCHKKTILIINTNKDIEVMAKNIKAVNKEIQTANIRTIDATKIALEVLGRNIVNTVILGKFAQASKLISLESLKIAIQEKFSGKGKEMVEKNILAVERAYQA